MSKSGITLYNAVRANITEDAKVFFIMKSETVTDVNSPFPYSGQSAYLFCR